LKKLHLSLIHFKTYQFLQSIIKQIYKIIYPIGKEEAKETLMQQIVGRNIIPYRSEMYEEGLIQFKNNIRELLTGLKNAGIPVIISDLVSNERDLTPFHSLKYKNFPPADSVFYLAKHREAHSLFIEAKEEYLRAKDLDCIRFRASEDLNKIIFALADSLDIYKISMKDFFEKHALHGIVGSDLMTEHVHPNIDGYFLMAECFLNAMRENTLIEKNWDSAQIKPAVYYRSNWGFTKLDSMIADLRIKHLKEGWPFKPAGTVNNFIFNYKPRNVIDSLAFLAVKYDNINSEKLHKDLAQVYSSRGDFKNASKEYISLAYAHPYNYSYYYFASDFAGKAKDYETVVGTLKGMPDYRENKYAQMTLASAFYNEKKYNEALSSIDNVLKLKLDEKEFLSLQKLKYRILKDSGMNSEAEIVLASIKKLDPGFHENGEINTRSVFIPQEIRSYIERAVVLRKKRRLKEALDILLEANSIKENAYTDLLIGKILSLNGDQQFLFRESL
jgi:tetratricopeptide (TPR) repeat protein